jgi:NAD(P)H-hydrate epimerase
MIPGTMTRDEVRDVDRRAIDEFGLPGIVLMENAGRGCVDWLIELGVSGQVVICAGRGNNGGDGFVIARHLENRGFNVLVLLFADPESLQGDAAINWRVLERAGTPVGVIRKAAANCDWRSRITSADWIIDALLGTGTRGSLREPLPEIISTINEASGRVFAIDLPSGLDCNTGTPVDADSPLAVKADFTATFVASKQGFENHAAAAFTGEVRVIDIGVPHSMFAASET